MFKPYNIPFYALAALIILADALAVIIMIGQSS